MERDVLPSNVPQTVLRAGVMAQTFSLHSGFRASLDSIGEPALVSQTI